MQAQSENTERIKSMSPSLLVSATYNNRKKAAILKFYEPKSQKIILWEDETNHKPYCYSKLNPEELDFLNERSDVIKIESIKRYDMLNDQEINVSKIIAVTLFSATLGSGILLISDSTSISKLTRLIFGIG